MLEREGWRMPPEDHGPGMQGWLRRIDHFLIDRIFQPVANALEQFAQPHQIAETMLLGAAVMVVGAAAARVTADGLDGGSLIDAALNIGGATWLWIWYRRHGALARGAANPFRELPIFVLLRLLSLVMLIPDLLPAFGVAFAPALARLGFGPERGQAALFGGISDVLTVAGLYFAACNRPPPRNVRQRHPAWLSRLALSR